MTFVIDTKVRSSPTCDVVDLRELVDELQLRDVEAPVLIRFPDILDNRIEKIANCFKQASDEYGYKAQNFIIYPIKVNQMRPVVEEIIGHGKKFNLGLEAGSNPIISISSTTSRYQPKNLTPIHFVRLVKDGKSTGISLYITSVN